MQFSFSFVIWIRFVMLRSNFEDSEKVSNWNLRILFSHLLPNNGVKFGW